MSTNVILGLALIALIFIILIFSKIGKKKAEKLAKKIEGEEGIQNSQEEPSDFDEEFFARTQAGETYQHFASLSSQRDCAILRSLLAADDVPTYVEGEHMNNIYGGISGAMNAVVAIKLFVLSNDYDKALDITRDFLQKKAEKLESEAEETAKEKALETVGAIIAIPATFSRAQEFLGITILPKAYKD